MELGCKPLQVREPRSESDEGDAVLGRGVTRREFLLGKGGPARELGQIEGGVCAVDDRDADSTRTIEAGVARRGVPRDLLGDSIAAHAPRVENDEERPGRRNRVPESCARGGREGAGQRDRGAIGLVVGSLRKVDEKNPVADVAKTGRRRQDRPPRK